MRGTVRYIRQSASNRKSNMSIFDIFKKKPVPVEPAVVESKPEAKAEPKPKKPRKPRAKKQESVAPPVGNQPEVKVLKFDFDPNNPRLGSIELDWNPEFVEMLRTHGYSGITEEAVVDAWLMDVCKTISGEVPYMDNVRYIQRRNLGDGKTEFS